MFVAVWFTVAKVWRQPDHPSGDERIKSWGTFTPGVMLTFRCYIPQTSVYSLHMLENQNAVPGHGWPVEPSVWLEVFYNRSPEGSNPQLLWLLTIPMRLVQLEH